MNPPSERKTTEASPSAGRALFFVLSPPSGQAAAGLSRYLSLRASENWPESEPVFMTPLTLRYGRTQEG